MSAKSPKIGSKHTFMATGTTREKLCDHPVTKKTFVITEYKLQTFVVTSEINLKKSQIQRHLKYG